MAAAARPLPDEAMRRAHRRPCRGALMSRVVDLFALGLPAVLAAHLLPAVRALQSARSGRRRSWRSRSVRRSWCCWRAAAMPPRRGSSPPSSPPAGCGSPGPSISSATPRINWAAAYFARAFAAQALLLVWRVGRGGCALRGRTRLGRVGPLPLRPGGPAADRPARRPAMDAGRGLRAGARSHRGRDAGPVLLGTAECAGSCWSSRCCGARSRA